MKKSFVYLMLTLMMAAMLCGCGMDADDGVIGASPRPTDTIDSASSMIPQVSPTVIPDTDIDVSAAPTTSNPQVGSTGDVKVSPNVSDTKNR